MLFSEHFNVERDYEVEIADWFDPILHQDTRLFIDPFLVFKSKDPLFEDSYSKMMEFFNRVFELVAESGGKRDHMSFRKAIALLRFHEVNELCLGYSPNRTGAGPGRGWAEALVLNIVECIKRGITHVKHFEEVGLFSAGIGADMLSDITANLLKDRLVAFTQEICRLYNIPTRPVMLHNSFVDRRFWRWESNEVQLPFNPFKNTGILLVPKGFLKELPEINKKDFWDSISDNEILRNDLNYEISRNVDSQEIARIAIEHYGLVKEYVNQVEQRQPRPYDVITDFQLVHKWYQLSKEICRLYPLSLLQADNAIELEKQVGEIVNYFVDYVNLKAGYKLLWDDSFVRPRNEKAVQLLFNGIVESHCRANNIDFSPEVNQGRGPVDFKFSSGYHQKVLLEIKLANNTQFWNGLRKQLPFYMKSETARDGYFLVVAYREDDLRRIRGIQDEVSKVNKELGNNIRVVVVDALPNKPSASKL